MQRKQAREELLTSSEDTIGVWASRETLVSLAFFARLAFWA
jgi:hypothetical protein